MTGPLHPLPVPDQRGDSVAIDFVGPLPEENGFNCILTMTDRLGSEILLVPTRMDATAQDIAALFFEHWFCEHGLPLDIVCDRDVKFVSRNRTVVQALRFHVERTQNGWVKALPRIRFCMMNTVNASTGFSGFQLKMGRSPRLVPPVLVEDFVDAPLEKKQAMLILKQLELDLESPHFAVGDRVMLSTANRRREYKA